MADKKTAEEQAAAEAEDLQKRVEDAGLVTVEPPTNAELNAPPPSERPDAQETPPGDPPEDAFAHETMEPDEPGGYECRKCGARFPSTALRREHGEAFHPSPA